VGDYDNDGRVDFFFSNVGSTPPTFLVKGDLRDDQDFNPRWILFRNRGDFGFEDTADATALADFEFSWGAVFEDFNLDGRPDLVVSENFVDFPPHKIEFLRLPALSMGVYVLEAGAKDLQTPHDEDEVYYVVSGRGVLQVEGRDQPVQAGSVVFVAGKARHHFHSIEEELTTLVFFAPAEGSAAAPAAD